MKYSPILIAFIYLFATGCSNDDKNLNTPENILHDHCVFTEINLETTLDLFDDKELNKATLITIIKDAGLHSDQFDVSLHICAICAEEKDAEEAEVLRHKLFKDYRALSIKLFFDSSFDDKNPSDEDIEWLKNQISTMLDTWRALDKLNPYTNPVSQE